MRQCMTLRLLAILFVAIFFFVPLFCSPGHAAKGAPSVGVTDFGPKIDNKAPIKITADRMEARQQARTILFDGHVVVRQSDLTITSKQLKVILAKEDQNAPSAPKATKASNTSQASQADSSPQQRVDYIDFTGDVRVTQQDRVATAQEAIFYQKEQKILLEGSPVVTKGQDRIEGKLITIYLKDNRCVVEGGSGAQVRAVLFPEKKQ